MTLDPTTETVAHFIGLFHLDVEGLRLRSDYETFSALKASQEFEPLTTVDVEIHAPHLPGGFKPDFDHAAPATPPPVAAATAATSLPVPETAQPEIGTPADAPPAFPELPPLQLPQDASIPLHLPLANSIVTVTQQTILLRDDDLLTQGHDAQFVAPAIFAQRLEALAGTAEAATAFGGQGIDLAALSPQEAAAAVRDMLDGDPPPPTEGAVLLRGEDASGVIVDGAPAEALPDLDAARPAHLTKDDAAGADAARDDTAGKDTGRDDTARTDAGGVWTPDPSGPHSMEPGHHVVTGANTATNDTAILTNWVDAPVIAVAGDVVDVDGISQVNVLAGTDAGTPADPAPGSKTVNAAEIATTSSAPLPDPVPEPDSDPEPAPAFVAEPDPEPEPGPDTAPDPEKPASETLGLPANWVLDRIETDLVAVNKVDQHIFASDTDRVEVSFTGASTDLGLGENVLFNAASLAELGFHYDLILVGGDMITLNLVEQINVLLDADVFSGTAAGLPASGQDNLLANTASVQTTGIDSFETMADGFADALEDLAAGAKTLAASLLAEAEVAGRDLAKALYVAGDLVKANLVKQHTYLGDADQLHVAKEALLAAQGAQAEIVTGSNLLANTAEMIDLGLDSTVMAAGEVYSDAFIHQADLLADMDVPAAGDVAALANEAVAFLADGMIEETGEGPSGSGPPPADPAGSLDVMESVLA